MDVAITKGTLLVKNRATLGTIAHIKKGKKNESNVNAIKSTCKKDDYSPSAGAKERASACKT